MRKLERLYCIVVGINLALFILALDMHWNWKSDQSQNCIVLFLIVSVLASIGVVAYFYYPSSKKIVLGTACANIFNAAFWSFFESSKISSKTSITVGFVAFVIVLLFIGVLIIGKYIPNNTTIMRPVQTFHTFSSPTYQSGTMNPASQQYVQRQFPNTNTFSTILYHGTPQLENAADIISSGFVIGSGNAYGTGFYLADLETAKEYAKGTGVIIMVKFEAPSQQIADYNSVINSKHFKNWTSLYGNGNHGDHVTNYALTVCKKRFLRVNQNFYVALADSTVGNERVVFEGLTILGVLNAFGNPI